MFEQLILGFGSALTLTNLLFTALGITVGIIFGALPGLGGITAMSILIPVTFYMSPLIAISFLIGIMKGSTSGGAVPAILLNAPGDSMNVATCFDGYPLAKKGQALKALRMALYSSCLGDWLSDIVLIAIAAPFAAVALKFGPAELTMLILLSFTLIAGLSGASMLKGIMATGLGLFLSTIGLDPTTGTTRMTFGIVDLYDGISINALAIGSLVLSSIYSQMFDMWRKPHQKATQFPRIDKNDKGLTPREFFSCWRTLLRSTYIGTAMGALPGLGSTLASFVGYGTAKKISKQSEKFGTGVLEGIAATEAANSATQGANLIPTIALGIPGSLNAALLIGAFMIHGVTPGPFMMVENGELVYAIFASMLMANLLHALIGRFGSPIWVKTLSLPFNVLLPAVTVICIIGVYIPASSVPEVLIMFLFAVLGYAMRKTGYSLVSLFMGCLLGPMLEHSLKQTMILYKGNLLSFLQEPICMIVLCINLFVIWKIGFSGIKTKMNSKTS